MDGGSHPGRDQDIKGSSQDKGDGQRNFGLIWSDYSLEVDKWSQSMPTKFINTPRTMTELSYTHGEQT